MIRFTGRLLYYSFAQYLPKTTIPIIGKVFKWIRYLLIKMIFEEVGVSVNVEPMAYFGNGKNVRIGNFSGIGKKCRIPNNIVIGKYVMMADEVVILNNNHKFECLEIPMSLQGINNKTQLIIEDDVWLGLRAIILPSVRKIGKGSIIGAGAVVTKDVPSYSIVAGNPARTIKSRQHINEE